jgi:hypothetical protein
MRVDFVPNRSVRCILNTDVLDIWMGPLGVAFAVPAGTTVHEVVLRCTSCDVGYPMALEDCGAVGCPQRK